jgi:hypothetical protein
MRMGNKAVDDEYVQWRHSLPSLPDPQRVTMSPGSHLGPQFPGQSEDADRIAGPDNVTYRNPGGWYGNEGSEK